VRVFRIGAAKYAKTAETAFSGEASLYGDGRWHHRGRPIVYAAEHLSLAMLEILVHLERRDEIQPFVSWDLEIPDNLVAPPPSVPESWQDNLELTRHWGDQWLAKQAAPVVRVPSFVIPTEFNFLLNPHHPQFTLKWVVKGPKFVVFDPRLLQRDTW
jgi:RES domain-containing protein